MVPERGTRVLKAALGNDAGMIGAASLAIGPAGSADGPT
jgi:hypothetical protein